MNIGAVILLISQFLRARRLIGLPCRPARPMGEDIEYARFTNLRVPSSGRRPAGASVSDLEASATCLQPTVMTRTGMLLS